VPGPGEGAGEAADPGEKKFLGQHSENLRQLVVDTDEVFGRTRQSATAEPQDE